MTRLRYLNSYLSLPIELIDYIKNFLTGRCEKCEIVWDEYYLYKNCVIYKYYNIFDDRYFFPREMEEYTYLCLMCKNKHYPCVNHENTNDTNDTNDKKIYLMDYSICD